MAKKLTVFVPQKWEGTSQNKYQTVKDVVLVAGESLIQYPERIIQNLGKPDTGAKSYSYKPSKMFVKHVDGPAKPKSPTSSSESWLLVITESQEKIETIKIRFPSVNQKPGNIVYRSSPKELYDLAFLPKKGYLIVRVFHAQADVPSESEGIQTILQAFTKETETEAISLNSFSTESEKERRQLLLKAQSAFTSASKTVPAVSREGSEQPLTVKSARSKIPELLSEDLSENQTCESLFAEIKQEAQQIFAQSMSGTQASVKLLEFLQKQHHYESSVSRRIAVTQVSILVAKIVFSAITWVQNFRKVPANQNKDAYQVWAMDVLYTRETHQELEPDVNGLGQDEANDRPRFVSVVSILDGFARSKGFRLRDLKLDELVGKFSITEHEISRCLGQKAHQNMTRFSRFRDEFDIRDYYPVWTALLSYARIEEDDVFVSKNSYAVSKNFGILLRALKQPNPHNEFELQWSLWERFIVRSNRSQVEINAQIKVFQASLPTPQTSDFGVPYHIIRNDKNTLSMYVQTYVSNLGKHGEKVNAKLVGLFKTLVADIVPDEPYVDRFRMMMMPQEPSPMETLNNELYYLIRDMINVKRTPDILVIKLVMSCKQLWRRTPSVNGQLDDLKMLKHILDPHSIFHKAVMSLFDPSIEDPRETADPAVKQVALDFAKEWNVEKWLDILSKWMFFAVDPTTKEPLFKQPPPIDLLLSADPSDPQTGWQHALTLLKQLKDPQVMGFIKLLQRVHTLKLTNRAALGRNFETSRIALWAGRMQHFVNQSCCMENPQIGILKGLVQAMDRNKTNKSADPYMANYRHGYRRVIEASEEKMVFETLLGFLLTEKATQLAFRQSLTRKIERYEKLLVSISKLNKLMEQEAFQSVGPIHALVKEWYLFTSEEPLQARSVLEVEQWIQFNQFENLLQTPDATQVEYFKTNRVNKYFEAQFQFRLSAVSSISTFVIAITESKAALLKELTQMSQGQMNFTYEKFRFYMEGVVRPDKQAEISIMLKSIELPFDTERELIRKAKQFTAFINLYVITTEGYLNRFINWERFIRDNKKLKNRTLVDNILELQHKFAENKDMEKKDLSYQMLMRLDSKKLTDNELIQNMLTNAFEVASKGEQLVIFLSESTKEFLQKIKDECDISYLTMINELEEAMTKFAFMYDEDINQGVYDEQAVFEQLFKLTQKEFVLVSQLNANLFTLKGLKAKAQGDRKKLAEDILSISCAVFKRIEQRETFEFTMFTPIINKVKPEGQQKQQKSQVSEKQLAIDDLRKKTYEQLHQGAYYTYEDMRGHFTYASILATELERTQTSNPEDMGLPQNNEQFQRLELMRGMTKTGQEIMKFKLNLDRLHELGIIRKEFSDDIIDLLGNRHSKQKFLFNSLTNADPNKEYLFLKIDKEETLDMLVEANQELDEMIASCKESYRQMINDSQTSGMSYFSGERAYNLFLFIKNLQAGETIDTEPTKWLLAEYLNDKDRFEATSNLLTRMKRKMEDTTDNFDLARAFFNSTELNPAVELRQETKDDRTFSSTSANVIDVRKFPQGALNTLDFMLQVTSHSSKHSRPSINLSQMLFCNEQTTDLELSAFVSRCFLDKYKRVFFILNTKELPEHRLSDLIQSISKIYSSEYITGESTLQEPATIELKRHVSSQHRKEKLKKVYGGKLIILNNSQPEVFPVMEGFEDITSKFESKDPRVGAVLRGALGEDKTYRLNFIENLRKIKVVTSSQAGLGKTYRIRHEARELKQKGYITDSIELSISGEITRQSLAVRMEKLYNQIKSLKKEQRFALHIKLDYIEDFDKHACMIDFLLYSILFAGKANNSSGIIFLSDRIERVFIEIGNSIKAKIEGLEMIKLLKAWDDQNKKTKKAEEKFTSELFTEISTFRSESSVIGYSKPADPIFYACATIIQQINSLKGENQVWKTVPIPDLKPPGAFYQASKDDLEFPSMKHEDMSRILKKEFLQINCQEFENFFCFEYWVKTILCLVKDLQTCAQFGKDTGTNNTMDPRELLVQTLREVVTTAVEALKIHNPNSLQIQRDVIEIYEAGNDKEMEELLEKKKAEGLKEKIEQKSWDTDKLFIPICSTEEFIPVVGTDNLFSAVSANTDTGSRGESYQNSSRAILRRYIVKMRGDYQELMFANKVPDEKSQDHSWFAYCLSKMDLKAGVKRKYEDIMRLTKDFPRLTPESDCEKKGYALTRENFMKINLMLLKARLKQPIIIMGESGCGKTYLSQFVVEALLEDKLRMITLYSGFSESNLINLIASYVEEAKVLQKEGKNLWVFFDEFNTTAIQSIIADLLIDRVYPTKQNLHQKVPDNMLFIGCCNPFRIKLDKADSAMIGLVPHEKTTRLSHIVKPIPDRLLNLVMDFGQLSKEDEKFYIDSLVRAENLFELADLNPAQDFDSRKVYKQSELMDHRLKNNKYSNLSLLIHRVHSYVRLKEERSGVSLRDIKRVCLMFKWFRRNIYKIRDFLKDTQEEKFKARTFWITKSDNFIEIAASLCAVSVCYVLRMNGYAEYQKELYQIMHAWATYAAKLESINYNNVIEALRQVSQAFLYNIKKIIPSDTSQNQAFEENFITLLACYSMKIPLIIVGAPGTSKTLSTNMLLQSLDGNKEQYALLKDCEEAESIYFGGSQTSTSEAVETLFDRADNFLNAEKKRRQEFEIRVKAQPTTGVKKALVYSNKAPVIFFDELGLAELSPHNPLKVMHSRLETNQGKIAFIGVSNWKPDQSKLNRMVCLMRPDMTRKDLIEIFETSLNSLMKPGEFPKVKKVFECLSDAYLTFRDWQKHIGKENRVYHPYFHGSRDIYGCYNYLFHQIKVQSSEISQINQESIEFQRRMLEIIKNAIERNLNGEMYYFRANKSSTKATEITKRLLNQTALYANESEKNLGFFGQWIGPEHFKEAGLVQINTSGDLLNLSDIYQGSIDTGNKWFNLTSSEVFKYIYWGILAKKYQYEHKKYLSGVKLSDWIKDPLMKDLVSENIADSNSRFMIVRSEGQIVDELMMQTLKSKKQEILKRQGKQNESLKIVDWRQVNDKDGIDDLLSSFKTYVSHGYTVVMKNLDSLYGGLYDLFNQKYTTVSSEMSGSPNTKDKQDKTQQQVYFKKCFLYYGETKHSVTVHEEFKCIILVNSSVDVLAKEDIQKKHPAPFLNRFEKYFLKLPNLLTNNQFNQILDLRKMALKCNGGLFSVVPSLNLDYLISVVSNQNPFLEKEEIKLEQYVSVLQLATSNLAYGDLKRLFDQDSMIEVAYKNLQKLSFSQILENLLNANPLSKQKSLVLTFSPKSKLDVLLKTPAFKDKAKEFKVMAASAVARNFLVEKDTALQDVTQPLIIQFSNSQEYPLISAIRRIINERPNIKSSVLIVHMSKTDREIIGKRVVKSETSKFLQVGERSRLLQSGGVSKWDGWSCQTCENLEYEIPISVVDAIMNKKVVDCFLPISDQPKEKDNELNGWIRNFADLTIKRVICSTLEGFSISENIDYGEIDVPKLRNLFSSSLSDHPAMKELYALLRPAFKAKIEQSVENTLRATAKAHEGEDLYEDLSTVILRTVLENNTLMQAVKKVLETLNSYCCNLYTTFSGIFEDLETHPNKEISLQDFAKYSKYMGNLLEGLNEPHLRRPNLQALLENNRLSLPRSLRTPESQIYARMVTRLLKPPEDETASVLNKDNVRMLANQFLKSWSVKETNSAAQVEQDQAAKSFIEIENYVLINLEQVASELTQRPNPRSSVGPTPQDRTIDMAIDLIRIVYSGKLGMFKNTSLQQSDLDVFYRLCKTLIPDTMVDTLTKKHESQGRVSSEQGRQFTAAVYPMYMCCEFFSEQLDSIMKSIYLLSEPVEQLKSKLNTTVTTKAALNAPKREVTFFDLKLLDSIYERLKFESFKQERSYGKISLSEIVIRLKVKTGIDPNYKKLIISTYELLNVLEKSDKKMAFSQELIEIEFPKDNHDHKESNKRFDQAIMKCVRNIYNLALIDNLDVFTNIKKNKPEKFVDFVDTIGQMLRYSALISKSLSLYTEPQYQKILVGSDLFNREELQSIANQISQALIILLKDFTPMQSVSKIAIEDIKSTPFAELNEFCNALCNCQLYPAQEAVSTMIANNLYIEAVRLKESKGASFDLEMRSKIGYFSNLCHIYKVGVQSFEPEKNPEDRKGLAVVLASVLLRMYFHKGMMTRISGGDHQHLAQIHTLLEEPLSNDLINDINNRPQCLPVVFYLQKIYSLNSKFTPDQIAKLSPVKKMMESIKETRDLTRITLFDDAMIKHYLEKLCPELDYLDTKSKKYDQTMWLPELESLISEPFQLAKGRSDPVAQMYMIGLYLVNTYVKQPPEDPRSVEVIVQKKAILAGMFEALANKLQQDQGTPNKQSDLLIQKTMFCNFAKNVLKMWSLGSMKHFYLNKYDEEIDVRVSKLYLQGILMAVCFPKEMLYNPLNIQSWLSKERIDQTSFNCKIVATENFKNYCNQLEVAINNRLSESGYRDYGPNLQINLGVYMCPCGFMYSVMNCGYAVMDTPCPRKCGRRIGGSNHQSFDYIKQIKTLEDIHKVVKTEYDAQMNNYSPHETSSESAMSQKIIDLGFQPILDSQKANTKDVPEYFKDYVSNFYFRHLMDHIYMLGLPYILDDKQQTQFKGLMDRNLKLDSEAMWKTYKSGAVNSPAVYFLHHVHYDLEKICGLIQLQNEVDVLDWFKAVLSKGADMILKKQSPDSRTKLYLDRGMFTNPQNILNEQHSATDKLASESFQVSTQTARKVVEQRIGANLHGLAIDDYSIFKFYRGLFGTREFTTIDALTKFENDFKEGGILQMSYPLIYICTKFQKLYTKYEAVLGSAIELYQYTDAMYSGKLSFDDATSKSVNLLSERDVCLKSLHAVFSDIWTHQVMEGLVKEFPDEFEFSFTCHTGMDVSGYIKKVADPAAPIINFVLMDSKSEFSDKTLFFPKAIIQSLIRKIQNPLVNMARRKMNLGKVVEGQMAEGIPADQMNVLMNPTSTKLHSNQRHSETPPEMTCLSSHQLTSDRPSSTTPD